MNWQSEQGQKFETQHSYDGYPGSPEQSSHTGEYRSDGREQTFQQQAYQPMPGYGLTSNRPAPVTATPPLSGSEFAAILSYSLVWFSGLLFTLLGGQKNRYVRFHAMQSMLFFGAINIIDIVLLSFIARPFYHHFFLMGAFAFLFFLLLNFVAFISWITAMIQAGRGAYYKLPIVGNIVARRMNLEGFPKTEA